MPARLRIGFVTTSFPRYSGDAAGDFVFALARRLADRGHKVEVVVPEPSSPGDWEAKASWLQGVEVATAPYARPRRFERLFWGDGVLDNLRASPWLAGLVPAAFAALLARTAVSSRAWDVAISHWLVPSALAAGAARIFGTRHIATAHSADVSLVGRAQFSPWLGEAVSRSADRFVFISETLRNEFLSFVSSGSARLVRGKSSVLPMGVDSLELKTARPREEIRNELKVKDFCILFLGRLVPIKGVDLLIDAVRHIENSTLVIAGDGSLRAALEKRAAECGVDARFLGFVGPDRRAELLSACDAVALPSIVLSSGRHEGMPLALIEAMQAGCPVVVSATGSMPELVEDQITGLVVQPKNAAALADALQLLYKNPNLAHRLGRSGKRRVSDRDWSVVTDFWEDLIYETIR